MNLLQITAAKHYHIYKRNITSPHERYAFTSTKILHPQLKWNRSSKNSTTYPKNIILFYFSIYLILLLVILTLIPVVYFIHI